MKFPIYVVSNNTVIHKAGEALIIDKNGRKMPCPTKNVSYLVKYGNSRISEQVLNYLSDNGIPVFRFSYGGKYNGCFVPREHNIGKTRQLQYQNYFDEKKRLEIAKGFVIGNAFNKIKTLQKLKSIENVPAIKAAVLNAKRATDIPSLRGFEGGIARLYFESFKKAFVRYEFKSREYNPPRDEINCLLSFCYALLYCEIHNKVSEHGLDAFCGFLHEQNNMQFPLVYDLSEIFKSAWCDVFVLRLVNQDLIQDVHFNKKEDGVVLLNTVGKMIFLKEWNSFLAKTQVDKNRKDEIISKYEIVREEIVKVKRLMEGCEYEPFNIS